MPLLLLTNHVNKGSTNNEHSMITMIGKNKNCAKPSKGKHTKKWACSTSLVK
jgi:hypothetical protein